MGGRRVGGGIKWARLCTVIVIVIVIFFEGSFHFIVQKRVRLCVWKGGVPSGHEKGRGKGKGKDKVGK